MVTDKAKGYTLVELMIVVVMLGIIGSTVATIMLKTIQAQEMANALNSIQQGAFTSFDVSTSLLRQASAASIVIDSVDASEPPWSRITFNEPATGKTISLYQKAQNFYINNVLAFNNLQRLGFYYPDTTSSNVIGISMTFSKSTGSGRSKAVQLFMQNVKIQNN
ncbi:MAG: prepilin-type N-terminal cleavage/methylation domain-containing protein [Elusimicrobiota bacterium]